MAEEEYDKAADCFRKTLETGRFRVDESRWYLALSLLKTGNLEEAESLIRKLSEYRNFYEVKALEIMTIFDSINLH